jgi:hypothetical protein
LVRLALVRGSARCEANGPGSIIDGLGRVLGAEVGLGAVLGRSLLDQLAAYKSLPGVIGLGAQVIFAMFPVIQIWL